jgi:hypothetical protein
VNLPVVRRFLLPHGVTFPKSAPLGVRATAPLGTIEDGDAVWISPPSTGPFDPVSISLTLPEPASLGAAIVIIGDVAGESGLFSRLLGREVRVPRAVRGSALLLAGYRNIAGAIDPASGLDLCWGEV